MNARKLPISNRPRARVADEQTVPPPAGASDVYSAQTRLGTLPEDVLAAMREEQAKNGMLDRTRSGTRPAVRPQGGTAVANAFVLDLDNDAVAANQITSERRRPGVGEAPGVLASVHALHAGTMSAGTTSSAASDPSTSSVMLPPDSAFFTAEEVPTNVTPVDAKGLDTAAARRQILADDGGPVVEVVAEREDGAELVDARIEPSAHVSEASTVAGTAPEVAGSDDVEAAAAGPFGVASLPQEALLAAPSLAPSIDVVFDPLPARSSAWRSLLIVALFAILGAAVAAAIMLDL